MTRSIYRRGTHLGSASTVHLWCTGSRKWEQFSGSWSFVHRVTWESRNNLIFLNKAGHLFAGLWSVGSAESLCLDCDRWATELHQEHWDGRVTGSGVCMGKTKLEVACKMDYGGQIQLLGNQWEEIAKAQQRKHENFTKAIAAGIKERD